MMYGSEHWNIIKRDRNVNGSTRIENVKMGMCDVTELDKIRNENKKREFGEQR